MGDADMVLYAAFSKVTNQYDVTFYDEDGTTVLKAATKYDYGTAAADIVKPDDPTKPADETYTYAFAGWDPVVADVTADATYKATYTSTYIDYTITYNTGDHPADSYTAPAAKTDAHNGVAYDLPAAATPADGYTFAGWSPDGGTTLYAGGASYTPTGTATLTAIYTENKYNVVYNANGGTGSVPAGETNVSYTANITIASGDGLTNNGYTFIGWSTDPAATTAEYSAGASVNKLSATDGANVTLYAVWSAAAYVITYDYDGADTPYPANAAGYDVTDLPITLTQPTKTGYDFTGWTIAVKSGEDGAAVVDGDTIKAGTWGNLTVKANWTPAEVNYTVKHWQQNLDNDDYTEVAADAQTQQGYTESDTAASAKTYTGFTAKPITQKTIAADGSTVVDVYYDRDTYTVTYAYTGSVPSGVTAPVDASSPYKYGATVTVKNDPDAVSGYTFGGWDKTGTFVIDADTTITGNWSLITYHINFTNDAGALVEAVPFTAETTSITAPAVPAKSENADWYEAGVWGAYDLTNLADQDVTPTYAKKTFTITFQDENGDPLADQGSDPTFDIDDKSVTPPAVPDKPGYTGTWPVDTSTAGDKTIQPTYTPINYTIKFETDGGTAIPDMTYTIESTDTLPAATGKTHHSFENWKVTTAGGNWAADTAINGGTPVAGRYGDVTLTAQWTVSLNYTLEEYKYAPAGYKMLIVDAAGAGDGNVYQYNGETMYYISDANYKTGTSTAVFYTLVEESSFSIDKIAAAAGTQATITYNGDVNGDGTINIADANAVFQMVVNTGSYYGIDQLTIAQRLAADMVKVTDNAEYRGSIEDVNAIVNVINGVG